MRLRLRDSTYPAGAATTTDTSTVARVTSRLLTSQVSVCVWVKTLTKFSKVNVAVLVDWADGRTDNHSTASTGTSTTAQMTNSRANRHHLPRSPCLCSWRLIVVIRSPPS